MVLSPLRLAGGDATAFMAPPKRCAGRFGVVSVIFLIVDLFKNNSEKEKDLVVTGILPVLLDRRAGSPPTLYLVPIYVGHSIRLSRIAIGPSMMVWN